MNNDSENQEKTLILEKGEIIVTAVTSYRTICTKDGCNCTGEWGKEDDDETLEEAFGLEGEGFKIVGRFWSAM